ncbi:hypothetical protein NMG60_11015066 [Bertholletia excelsa]
MATAGSPPSTSLLLTFLLIATPPPSDSLPSYSQLRTLFSLVHSLLTRVANLRASRGDLVGSNRARIIAAKLEGAMGLGFWRSMWSLGWDYLKNYAWQDAASFELLGAVSDVNELLKSMNELTRMESDSQRAEWVSRNYRKTLRLSKTLFGRFLKTFRQSNWQGPLREVVETLQREVMEGELLRDCLELGSSDLEGLLQIFKDIASNTNSYSNSEL